MFTSTNFHNKRNHFLVSGRENVYRNCGHDTVNKCNNYCAQNQALLSSCEEYHLASPRPQESTLAAYRCSCKK